MEIKEYKARKHQGTWPAYVNHHGHGAQCKTLVQRDPWPTRGAHIRPWRVFRWASLAAVVRVRGLEASKNQSTHNKTGEDQELTEDLSTFNRGTHRLNRFFFISFYFFYWCLVLISWVLIRTWVSRSIFLGLGINPLMNKGFLLIDFSFPFNVSIPFDLIPLLLASMVLICLVDGLHVYI